MSDDTFTINISDTSTADMTYTSPSDMTYTLSDLNDITYNTSHTFESTDFDGKFTIGDFNTETIDLDLLEKYPTAKSLYNEFKIVYNMCKANEELEE